MRGIAIIECAGQKIFGLKTLGGVNSHGQWGWGVGWAKYCIDEILHAIMCVHEVVGHSTLPAIVE